LVECLGEIIWFDLGKHSVAIMRFDLEKMFYRDNVVHIMAIVHTLKKSLKIPKG
jgi:hypothetical protein